MRARAEVAEGRSYHLFLAADDRGVCEQLRSWADADPRFRVTLFRTGWQLLRRVAFERPDLVLCDLALPGIDGMTVLRQLGPRALPIVMLSPQTQEGARAAIEALLVGAADYFVTKRRSGRMHVALTSAALTRRLLRLLGPAPREPATGGALGWARFSPESGPLTWSPCETQAAFPSHGNWTGFVLATPPSIGRLVRSLAAAPARPGGPMILQVCQPLAHTRALAEAATRHWDRVVLEFAEGEALRAGQWRMLPGRALLAPGANRGEGLGWYRMTNRVCDPEASLRRQIALLGGADETLRLYLFDPPGHEAAAMLRNLSDRGHAVFAHAGSVPLAAAPGPRETRRVAAKAMVAGRKLSLAMDLTHNLRRTR